MFHAENACSEEVIQHERLHYSNCQLFPPNTLREKNQALSFLVSICKKEYHVFDTVERLRRESPVPNSIANYHIIENEETVAVIAGTYFDKE